MQQIATKIFIGASIAFGVIGILMVIVVPPDTPDGTWPSILFLKLIQVCVFIILPSFALSVAGKYLDGK